MKCLFPLFGVLILFSLLSCQSAPDEKAPDERPRTAQMEEIETLMFDLSPREGALYFFTIVTREQYRENEVESCRREAARQLSRYFQINGVTYSRTNESVRGTLIKEAAGIAFNDDRAQRLVEELELVQSIQTDEGTAALFSYKDGGAFSLPYRPSGRGSSPDWINQSVRIPGYQTAVGFTGPKRFLERTLQQADKNALATLLEQRKGSLNITQKDWESTLGATASAQAVEKAAGSIQQAYVLSRWIDQRGNFYSLAVCPLP